MTVDVADHSDCTPLSGPAARIVLVDDHQMIRAGLSAALSAEPDLEVCGEAADGEAGAAVALRERPDVVLMDLAMPGMNGLEATISILDGWPEARVVILTALADLRLVRSALAAGASGYVLKDADPRSVVCAVRQAVRGLTPMSTEIADQLAAAK